MLIVDIAIVGAGPYGLSVGAHLAGEGRSVRVFGTPMRFWSDGVPGGMVLKSEGFASNLSDPGGLYPLSAFCAERGLPYADVGVPVTVERFVAYGRAFQERFVPQLDAREVVGLDRTAGGFQVSLQDGERFEARAVVLATGIAPFACLPPELRDVGDDRVTHSRDHADFTPFAGRRVVVVGAGASAMDAAAAAYRAGAEVTVISRREAIRFFPPLAPRDLWAKVTAPMTPLGPGWKKLACVLLPRLFHALPGTTRLGIVGRYLGPAPAWSVRDTLVGNVTFELGTRVVAAERTDAGVAVTFTGPDGATRRIEADHVIAATGYSLDLGRLGYLAAGLRTAIRCLGGAPVLSPSFETSVPGLYCVGTLSANQFGPMFRFVCGADYTARRLARHVARRLRRARTLRHDGGRGQARGLTDFSVGHGARS